MFFVFVQDNKITPGQDAVIGFVVVMFIAMGLSIAFLKVCIRLGEDLIHFTMKFTIALEVK